ncbi:hypothetical protein KIPB_010523, partial [Kipferlia bialata]
ESLTLADRTIHDELPTLLRPILPLKGTLDKALAMWTEAEGREREAETIRRRLSYKHTVTSLQRALNTADVFTSYTLLSALLDIDTETQGDGDTSPASDVSEISAENRDIQTQQQELRGQYLRMCRDTLRQQVGDVSGSTEACAHALSSECGRVVSCMVGVMARGEGRTERGRETERGYVVEHLASACVGAFVRQAQGVARVAKILADTNPAPTLHPPQTKGERDKEREKGEGEESQRTLAMAADAISQLCVIASQQLALLWRHVVSLPKLMPGDSSASSAGSSASTGAAQMGTSVQREGGDVRVRREMCLIGCRGTERVAKALISECVPMLRDLLSVISSSDLSAEPLPNMDSRERERERGSSRRGTLSASVSTALSASLSVSDNGRREAGGMSMGQDSGDRGEDNRYQACDAASNAFTVGCGLLARIEDLGKATASDAHHRLVLSVAQRAGEGAGEAVDVDVEPHMPGSMLESVQDLLVDYSISEHGMVSCILAGILDSAAHDTHRHVESARVQETDTPSTHGTPLPYVDDYLSVAFKSLSRCLRVASLSQGPLLGVLSAVRETLLSHLPSLSTPTPDTLPSLLSLKSRLESLDGLSLDTQTKAKAKGGMGALEGVVKAQLAEVI